MNYWNNYDCGCKKHEEEKDYYFKCEKVEKESPCQNQQYNQYFMPNKNCCCK